MIIGIDAGHMGQNFDGGAIGINKSFEADFTLKVALKLKEKLLKYKDIKIVMTREKSQVQSLQEKTKILNDGKCNYVISIHCNSSADSKGHGAETFCFRKGSQAENIGLSVQKAYIEKTCLADRGLKTANFYILRETDMPANLIELFFINNIDDYNKMCNKIDDMAEGIKNGLVRHFNLTPNETITDKGEGPQKGLWRVVVDSYALKENAVKKQNELKEKGVNSFLVFVPYTGLD